MKPNYARTNTVAAALFALASLSCAAASTLNDPVVITSDPMGAGVYINGTFLGTTPYSIAMGLPSSASATNRIKYDAPLRVLVRLKDYADQEQDFADSDVKLNTRNATKQKPWNIKFDKLERNHLEAPIRLKANVDGAIVVTNDQAAGRLAAASPVWSDKLIFNRIPPAPWPVVKIEVVKPNYSRFLTNITGEMAEISPAGFDLTARLDELQREIPVQFDANIPDATICINGIPAAATNLNGATSLKTKLVFNRASGAQPWPTITVRIYKDMFEYHPAGTTAVPEFSTNLTAESAGGTFSATNFQPVTFFPVPLRTFRINQDKLEILHTNHMAAIDASEPNQPALTPVTQIDPASFLVESRVSAWKGHPDKIVYSRLSWDNRTEAGEREVITGAHICVYEFGNGGEVAIDPAPFIDVDPFVSLTDAGNYIYFSSNREGKQAIFRMTAEGARMTQLSNKGYSASIDTEPVVSPDGLLLAYTSQAIPISPSAPSRIWITETQSPEKAYGTEPGHSPAWSPDAKYIAFVRDDKIWVMDKNGQNAANLSGHGVEHDAYPVWTPTGHHIIFASDRSINSRLEHNWGLWEMAADTGFDLHQLTRNGSWDSSPAVSSDGTYIYFLSNRGSKKGGPEFLRIYRIPLTPD